MDPRAKDVVEHVKRLKKAIASGDGPAAFAAAERAKVALEFRATDAMIGLAPVAAGPLDELERLHERALALAAEKGVTAALRELARQAFEEGDIDAAVEHYVAAAEEADAATLAEAADFIRRAGRRDLAKLAHRWLDGAGPSKDGAVEYTQALFAFHGFGCKKDLPRALRLHEEAARRGHADAMFELYAMCSQGLGGKADPKAALAWCERAAEAGNPRAMANLGGFYATGHGVPKDPARSVSWYERAAQAGHGKAAATLGLMFATGSDVKVDPSRARSYLALADDAGFDWRPLAAQLGVLDTLDDSGA